MRELNEAAEGSMVITQFFKRRNQYLRTVYQMQLRKVFVPRVAEEVVASAEED